MRPHSRPLAIASLSPCIAVALFCVTACARAENPPAAAPAPTPAAAAAPVTADKIGKLPHVEFNVTKRQVRVECESLAVDAPLEFFLCRAGTAEHEAVLRTEALPSNVHTGLLACGLKPGEPLTYVEKLEKWFPPTGPPLHVTVEFQDKAGKTVTYPAYRWLRDVKTKKPPPAFSWVFAGSRVTKEGRYAADDTGYMITVVNFDFAMIDIPLRATANNAELEWERNAELMPPKGTTVWLVIEPAGKDDPAGAPAAPATRPAAGSTDATGAVTPGSPVAPAATAGLTSDVRTDEAKVQAMIKRHDDIINPKAQALREAAQAHYDVIAALRAEQQRLINEADLLQRAIDELERKYADMTTPRPSPDAGGTGAAGGAEGAR